MLNAFVIANREGIIARAQARVATRSFPKPSDVELTNGIPVFLDQLGAALRLAESSDVIDHEELRRTAGRHGHDLLRLGLTVAQVVRDYGDVCQAITDLAVEQRAPIPPEEFRTLNLCLDDAIAEAVTEYGCQRERAIEVRGTERLGDLAHELRNLLNTAAMSFEMIKSGKVAIGGSTSVVLDRSLMGLRDLIDRSLADVRLDAGIERLERISVAAFIEEVEIGALIQAQARGVQLEVTSVDRTVTIEGDRQILAAAVANLLQNAFKFTPKAGHVSFRTFATEDRLLFEVEDQCGGLPPGKAEDLFRPFEQRGLDRSGVGLGLSICVKAAKASGGELRVRDLPGKGCVFTIDLPRTPPPPLAVIDGGKARPLTKGVEAAGATLARGIVAPKARAI
ncbi:MAG: HAMP domain-containing histidine kinase [Myxococcota bacterium]|nr:HAMP domain-containing histidine kinase [Myxococcota bacterium]